MALSAIECQPPVPLREVQESMPTYEYACKSCQHGFEIHQSFTDDALTVCPECGGPLRKVFGNIGITFKGSGFYKTDSRSSSAGGSSVRSESGGPANDGAASSDSGSTSAPAPSTTPDAGGSKAGATNTSTGASASAAAAATSGNSSNSTVAPSK